MKPKNLPRLSLRLKYRILKEIVVLLGLLEFLGLGGGLFFAGAKEFSSSMAFFALMGISYYTSSKLHYKVLELLVRLESGKE